MELNEREVTIVETHASRITMPMTSYDDIRNAAITMRYLADALEECARENNKQVTAILEARYHITNASRALKGGTFYRGKTT